MSIEQTRSRILGWMSANRQGEDSSTPCFWSMYSLNSIYSPVPKSSAALGHNYHKATLEDSVDYLIERMNDSPHVRYYAIRLRGSKKDQGIIANFPNPHFSTYAKENKIGSLPQHQESSNFNMAILAMLQNQSKENAERKDEATQGMILMMQQMQQFQMDSLEQRLTHKAEIAKLRDENDGLRNTAPESTLGSIIKELKPEIRDFMRHKVYGVESYSDRELAGHQEDEAETPEEKNELVEEGLKLMKDKVARPAELIWKLGVVLDNLDPDKAKYIVNLLHASFQDVKKARENESM